MLPPSDSNAISDTEVANDRPTPTHGSASQSPDRTARQDSQDGELVVDANADDETRLQMLTVGAQDQTDLERNIGRQAQYLLTEQADERDKKRAQKAEEEIKRHEAAIQKIRVRLVMPMLDSARAKLHTEIDGFRKKIDACEHDLEAIQKRIDDRHKALLDGEADETNGTQNPLPNESRRDFLIRTGKITPFSKVGMPNPALTGLANTMLDAEMEDAEEIKDSAEQGPTSHRNLMQPGFEVQASSSDPDSPRPAKKQRTSHHGIRGRDQSSTSETQSPAESDDAYTPDAEFNGSITLDESGEVVEDQSDDDYGVDSTSRKRKAKAKPTTKKGSKAQAHTRDEQEDLAGVDDGNEKVFKRRIGEWVKNRSTARRRAQEKEGVEAADDQDDIEEWYKPHPTRPDTKLEGGLRIPGDIYPSLFDYQKTGVQWLWELYGQNVGGIVGDEMGLGKTIQAISFIAALHYSKKLTKPVIVVCPATVMKQWVNEFHRWWPALRVSILHTSGSGMLDTKREDRMERDLEVDRFDNEALTKSGKAAKKIVDKVKRDGHVLVTTYSGLQTYAEFLIPTKWGYAVLDEGHKIRNPNTSITIHCKELQTPHRIILSGTPIQNNLTELWSLFDFVFPMRLGTLVNFKNQFEFPIRQGGYANASNLQYETAIKCAETLKEAISPYLIQRMKVDVAADLPQKKEQVLFCKLTRQQREAYESFLASDEMKKIENGKRQMLFGVDYLRKVCNHPDLLDHKSQVKKAADNYGAGNKSGKMAVVKELLGIWKKNGHKTLLFAQQRIMLDILEKMVKKMPGMNYRRMDGETAIKNRQDMVDEFNNDPDIHVFLLTTKVGGLGINLTGADRVIIYDPDWNPSTDAQARERSWRLGQKRDVEIYRLMTAGTIEEKIYHRQIFKQFLTNKVLKDPKQGQTFQMTELYDLFTLGTDNQEGKTETGEIFRGSEVKLGDGKSAPPGGATSAEAKEVHSLVGIHHTEAIKAESPGDTGNADSGNAAGQGEGSEDRLLHSIFAKSGVHAALEHDKIVGATGGRKRKIEADPAMVQREAKRYAAEVAQELKKAEEVARTVPAGVPTWTGEQGAFGRPRPPPQPARRGGSVFALGRGRGGGPSSSGVLANLAARQGRVGSQGPATTSSSGTSTPTDPRGQQMLLMIRDFLVLHDGVVPTQMLIDHFSRYCRAPNAEAEFKELLRTVAQFERGARRIGRWRLKAEWKPEAGAPRGRGARG
jgi:DNA excision repair protein ERCC-6